MPACPPQEKLHAAAMAAAEGRLWLFGGQLGRSCVRALYSLDLATLTWRQHALGSAAPKGRAGHTLTSIGGRYILLFGGEGKRLHNDMYMLDPKSAQWSKVRQQGTPPTARRGHSMVWDGGDRLICFGGSTNSTTDSQLSVFTLSRNEWSTSMASGAIPSPRTHHSAVLIRPGIMLMFGGCNSQVRCRPAQVAGTVSVHGAVVGVVARVAARSQICTPPPTATPTHSPSFPTHRNPPPWLCLHVLQGVFFNDSYCLQLATMTWYRPQLLNPPPPPRYYHSCVALSNGKVVMFGGINTKQAFDSVVLFDTPASFGPDLGAVADELARMRVSGSWV